MFRWLFRPRPVSRPASRFRPTLEYLEDRRVPALTGSQILVDTGVDDDFNPAVGRFNLTGRSIVVYEHLTGTGNRDIRARLFDEFGAALGAGTEVIIASSANDEFDPEVAVSTNNNFVITWTRSVSGDLDVQYALYSLPTTAPTLLDSDNVAASTLFDESAAQVAIDGQGRFVVAYTRDDGLNADVWGRRFESDGAGVAFFQVATKANVDEFGPRIDRNDNGKFAISYVRSTVDFDEIFLRRYSVGGKSLGKNKIATTAGSLAPTHDVGIDDHGNCVVSFDTGRLDTEDDDIFARRVTKGGTAKPQLTLTLDPDFDGDPSLAIDSLTGGFVVAWRHSVGGTIHVFVREFDKDGNALNAFDMGAPQASGSDEPSIDCNPFFHEYIVGFTSNVSASDSNVYAQYGTL